MGRAPVFVILGMAICAIPLGVSAESEEPLDLEAVVELALAQNPALRAEIERRNEVVAGVREAFSAAWPQLDLVSSWSRSRNPALLNSPDFDDIIEQFPGFEPGEQELWDLAIELSQILYSSGKVRSGIELAKLVVEITEAEIETARLDTVLEAAEDYYELLAARSALETVEVQQQARRESLAVVEARFELGEATRLELLRARSALEQVAPTVARIRGRIEVAKSRLRVSLGMPTGAELAVAPAAGGEPDEPPELAALIARAGEQRPEIRDLRLRVDALERQRIITLADSRPQVELNGSYGRQSRLVEDLEDPLFDNWRVAVQMSMSLFDGGQRKAQAAQLDSQRDQLGWRIAALESRIAAEIEEALVEYRTARERWRAAEVSARAAREATHVARESYQLGAALQADLLDAQQQEIQAEFVRIDAFYDVLVEAAGLRRSVGVLPTEALVAGPPAAAPSSPDTDPVRSP